MSSQAVFSECKDVTWNEEGVKEEEDEDEEDEIEE